MKHFFLLFKGFTSSSRLFFFTSCLNTTKKSGSRRHRAAKLNRHPAATTLHGGNSRHSKKSRTHQFSRVLQLRSDYIFGRDLLKINLATTPSKTLSTSGCDLWEQKTPIRLCQWAKPR
jgi:hypothetical protein